MSYRQHKDCDCLIVDVCDHTVIPDTIPPLPFVIRYQRFPMSTGITTLHEILADPSHDEQGLVSVHLFQGFLS